MDPVSVWFTLGLLVTAFSASLFTKARVEEHYGRYVITQAGWLYRPTANVTAILAVFLAGAGSILVSGWYPFLLLATAFVVTVPGGYIYKSSVEFMNSPGRLGERLWHWLELDDRLMLRQANAQLRSLKRKSKKSAVLVGGAQEQARGALIEKAKLLVDDRIPRLLVMRRLLREAISDSRCSMPGAQPVHRQITGTFDHLAHQDDRMTANVTNAMEADLKKLEARYAHTEDYLRACRVLLVSLNSRWYLLITGEDPEALQEFMTELDDLIDREGKLIEKTEAQLEVVK